MIDPDLPPNGGIEEERRAKERGCYTTGGWCGKRVGCDGKRCKDCIRFSMYREKK